MALMVSEDKKDIIVSCKCGCENGLHIRIDHDSYDKDEPYAFITYLNGNWYRDQNDRVFRCIGRKLHKILAIIRNKDFYYSEVCMSKEDYEKFK